MEGQIPQSKPKNLKEALKFIYKEHLEDHHFKFKTKMRNFHDRFTPHKIERWMGLAFLLSLLLARLVYISKGWEIKFAMITYMLGLQYLSAAMLYLTPNDSY